MNRLAQFARALFLVCLALSCTARPCRAQSPPWLSSFQTAFRELQSGHKKEALDAFDSVWKQYPRDAVLATSIGGALDAASDHDAATAWYQRALSIQPGFGAALQNLAMNYALHGRLTEAADLLREKLNQDPTDVKAAYNLGLIDLRTQRYAEAASVLRRAADLPVASVPEANIRLAEATALFHLGRYRDVMAALGESEPKSADAFTLLGSAQALAGDLPTAVKVFQRAIQVYPDDPRLYFRLMLVLAEGRRDEDAAAVLQNISDTIRDAPLIAYGHAVLDEMMGRDDEAIQWAEKSLHAHENQPDVLGLLGTLYERRGDTQKAMVSYQRAVAYGAGPYVGAEYGELLVKLGRYKDAETELRMFVRRYPHDARVARAQGKLYRAEGQYADAEDALRRSIREDNGDPQTHYVLAQVLQHENRRADASEELKLYRTTKAKSQVTRILQRVEDVN